jgi:hypothetical protein
MNSYRSLYTGVYIGYIREFMYLFFYIYLLSLFLSLLYIFIFFGREERKRYILGWVEGWQSGRHGRAKISIYIQKEI